MVQVPDQDILELYSSLMAEVKSRLKEIERTLHMIVAFNEKGDDVTPDDKAALLYGLENCYLHLRRICELVALAVVAAHNPFPQFRSNKFVEQYNADKIMRQMGRLSPIAFPRRSSILTDQFGQMRIMFKPDVLLSTAPKDDVSRIYTECGDKLHSGHLRFLLEQRNKSYSAPFVQESMVTFVQMLNEHTIMLPDERVIQAMLRLEADEGVFCRWLTPLKPEPPVQPDKPFRGPPFAA